jgi:hypothetical protein
MNQKRKKWAKYKNQREKFEQDSSEGKKRINQNTL